MSNSKSKRLTIPTDLYTRLATQAQDAGLTPAQALQALILGSNTRLLRVCAVEAGLRVSGPTLWVIEGGKGERAA